MPITLCRLFHAEILESAFQMKRWFPWRPTTERCADLTKAPLHFGKLYRSVKHTGCRGMRKNRLVVSVCGVILPYRTKTFTSQLSIFRSKSVSGLLTQLIWTTVGPNFAHDHQVLANGSRRIINFTNGFQTSTRASSVSLETWEVASRSSPHIWWSTSRRLWQ